MGIRVTLPIKKPWHFLPGLLSGRFQKSLGLGKKLHSPAEYRIKIILEPCNLSKKIRILLAPHLWLLYNFVWLKLWGMV